LPRKALLSGTACALSFHVHFPKNENGKAQFAIRDKPLRIVSTCQLQKVLWTNLAASFPLKKKLSIHIGKTLIWAAHHSFVQPCPTFSRKHWK
jgi:hypothetical protein